MLSMKRTGGGLFNSLLNKLPVEVHLPGYQYCGPGTKLQTRLQRGDPGINPLDRACKVHDIAYSKSHDLKHRHEADRILEERAWDRVKSADATLGEKAAAWTVTNAMKAKRKLGMGLGKSSKRPKVSFRKSLFERARNALRGAKHLTDLKQGATLSLKAAKAAVKVAGGKKHIRTPRIIPLPKTGGFLPLIPLFAGLSALGALAGGASGIAQAVSKAKSAQRDLEEAQRHNKAMEAIALGKKGDGLYLKPYRKGLGLFLNPKSKRSKNC